MRDFDKDELKLDTLYNRLKNAKKELKWSRQETKISEYRINHLKAELFFLYIDRYINELDEQIMG